MKVYLFVACIVIVHLELFGQINAIPPRLFKPQWVEKKPENREVSMFYFFKSNVLKVKKTELM